MDNKVNSITIEKYQGGFIIKYKGKNVWKQENPTIWELVEEPCLCHYDVIRELKIGHLFGEAIINNNKKINYHIILLYNIIS